MNKHKLISQSESKTTEKKDCFGASIYWLAIQHPDDFTKTSPAIECITLIIDDTNAFRYSKPGTIRSGFLSQSMRAKLSIKSETTDEQKYPVKKLSKKIQEGPSPSQVIILYDKQNENHAFAIFYDPAANTFQLFDNNTKGKNTLKTDSKTLFLAAIENYLKARSEFTLFRIIYYEFNR